MTHYQVLSGIAEFAEFGKAVVIKQSDWESLVAFVKALPSDIEVPNFDILPLEFSMDYDD